MPSGEHVEIRRMHSRLRVAGHLPAGRERNHTVTRVPGDRSDREGLERVSAQYTRTDIRAGDVDDRYWFIRHWQLPHSIVRPGAEENQCQRSLPWTMRSTRQRDRESSVLVPRWIEPR
jgi:hypothetical protein